LPECPLERSSFFSYIVFAWVIPVFIKGYKKELTNDDMYQPLKAHKSEMLGDKICEAWDNELRQCSKDKEKKPSLLRAGLKVFGGEIAMLGVVMVILELGVRLSQPLFIGGLVSYYSQSSEISQAYFFAGGVIISCILNVMIAHPYMLTQLHLGMKLRVAACSMIYRKSLRLTKSSLGDTTSGQITNLLSNDVARLELSVLFLHYLWVGPIEVVIVSIIMYKEIGVSTFFGIAFLLLFIPVQIICGKLNSKLRLKTALRTDERVRLMQEVISGIQVIKMYAWEKPFAKLIEEARRKEIQVIRKVSYLRGILLSFILFLTRVSIFLSLVGFALLGNYVDAQKAFIVTAYFNVLRTSMTVFFPQGVGQLAETLVSIKRIQKYMLYDELKGGSSIGRSLSNETSQATQSTITKDHGNDFSKDIVDLPLDKENAPASGSQLKSDILITNLYAKWDAKNNPEYTLNDVSLVLKPGVNAIIGPVGSSKSSLIQAILGELPLDSGNIQINGNIAYASQEPWLFSASIRQNILFGLPYEKDRYKKVVKVCALERDFTLFSNGDKTIVGERGASLSGGQKARINLARAVYRKVSIYLLDDPLSAVDTHVGRHLFEECVQRYLKGNTVILITHQLQYLANADQIVIMEHGSVKATGTYDQLKDSGLDFAKLLDSSEEHEKDGHNSSRSSSRSLNRRISESSVGSDLNLGEETVAEDLMVVAEGKSQGKIAFDVYKKYVKAGGGIPMFIALTFMLPELRYSTNQTEVPLEFRRVKRDFTEDWNNLKMKAVDVWESIVEDEYFDVYLFTAITILTVAITLGRSFLFFNASMRASKNLHSGMFNGISRATMYFFHTNPSGRILNRFSKDMGQIDEILPAICIDVVQIFLALAGIIIVVAIVNPYFLIPTIIIGIIFYLLRIFYLKTSTSLKRVEATNRSPIYSHLTASLNGLSTIRAFKAEQILVEEFDSHQDLHSSAFYLFLSISRSFGFWLDAFCVVYIAIITMSFFVMENTGGNVGLAITQALGMTGMVQWGMRQSAELENTFTSVERVVEYETVDPEPELESAPDKKPPQTWPEKGNIVFDKLSLKYFPDPDAEKVLHNLEFEIQPQEKVGIVGRTGAGKSSLINALFRLSYNEGRVIIDTRDSNEIGLHDLRSKISIIPQEPVLFSGTLRYNLDPFDEYPDSKIWLALEEVKLKSVILELPAGLHSRITEGGSNFSVGQRQLVCLARAILRENKILVMDEATANVDPQTDALIQETIRSKFANCTVLTIAHRLNTVMDSDKVLVMDAGRCVEFGAPYELLTDEGETGIFYEMVKKTGKSMFDNLLLIAKQVRKAF
ncbi:unnamed protein product, partial [Sphagnum compactum]